MAIIEATFELSEPQPSLPVLLASAFSAVYPCHVPQQVMRTRPIGTGPFKFAEFKRGDSIRLVRNPDYWKKGRPYLDEITFKMIDSRSTRMLAFATGEFDITFPARFLAQPVTLQTPCLFDEPMGRAALGRCSMYHIWPPHGQAHFRTGQLANNRRRAFVRPC